DPNLHNGQRKADGRELFIAFLLFVGDPNKVRSVLGNRDHHVHSTEQGTASARALPFVLSRMVNKDDRAAAHSAGLLLQSLSSTDVISHFGSGVLVSREAASKIVDHALLRVDRQP